MILSTQPPLPQLLAPLSSYIDNIPANRSYKLADPPATIQQQKWLDPCSDKILIIPIATSQILISAVRFAILLELTDLDATHWPSSFANTILFVLQLLRPWMSQPFHSFEVEPSHISISSLSPSALNSSAHGSPMTLGSLKWWMKESVTPPSDVNAMAIKP